VKRGEEIPRGLIVACSDGAGLFEFAKEILDQVACGKAPHQTGGVPLGFAEAG
jgi:hypothetical protein